VISRRRLLTGFVLAWAPLRAAAAQEYKAGKVYRVGVILVTPIARIKSDPTHAFNSAFRPEMRDRGYVEGQNLVLELRSLEGRIERSSEIVAELVRLNVDVIVTPGLEMTRQAKRVTTTVPIVTYSRAPVEEGLVVSLARPGGNITGLTPDTGPDLERKRLELLREGLSKPRRVAYLGTKADWEGPGGISIRASARALGLTFFLAEPRPNDYAGAFDLIARKRPDAIIISQDVIHYPHRRLIAEFAARNSLPSMSSYREFVEAGGLMSYGIDSQDIFRRIATYVDKILKGAKPGDLPIEQPTKFELVINLRTAKALGLTIPPPLLQRADQVIE